MRQSGCTTIIQFQDILREDIKRKLDNLFWDDPYIYSQICKYCVTMRIDRDAKEASIAMGLLDEKGNLPKVVREAVYELTTGLPIS